MADKPGFLVVESKSIEPPMSVQDRILMRQARTGASSIPTRFTLADGVISFAPSDIGDLGVGTLRYFCNLYSAAIVYPGYIPQILASFHPLGLKSTTAYPLPFNFFSTGTGALVTTFAARAELDTSTNELKVKIEGQSSVAGFGAHAPGTTSVFSYYVLDGAAEGLAQKI